MIQWELKHIGIGCYIPWCVHENSVGRMVYIVYSAIYTCYRITCDCGKTYSVTVTGKYVEGGQEH